MQFDCENCGTEITEVELLEEPPAPGNDLFVGVPSDAEVICGHCGEETGTTVEEVR